MDELTSEVRGKAGGPTRDPRATLHLALLETALDVIRDRGFELAKSEAIVQKVGMTKRTVYARHPHQAALFRAAVNRAFDRYAVPQAKIEATEIGDLELVRLFLQGARPLLSRQLQNTARP